jgi:hypothetical protein
LAIVARHGWHTAEGIPAYPMRCANHHLGECLGLRNLVLDLSLREVRTADSTEIFCLSHYSILQNTFQGPRP